MRSSTCVWSWELGRRACAGASLGGLGLRLPPVRDIAVWLLTWEPDRREAFVLRLMQIRRRCLWRCRACPMTYPAFATGLGDR